MGASVAAADAVRPVSGLVMVTHSLRFDLRDLPMAALFAVTGVTAFYGTCQEDQILMMPNVFSWSEHLNSC